MYRIDALIKQERKLFHTRDLALIWAIENNNTLYTLIKRYLKKGVLIPIHKGFYSTVPLEKIDPIVLGISFLHRFAYLSCESILGQEGVIFQQSPYITLVSSVSEKFAVGKHQFWVRKMKDEFLHHPAGLKQENDYQKATLERAVADLLYFNPLYHFDNLKAIDWKKVKLMQREVGFK